MRNILSSAVGGNNPPDPWDGKGKSISPPKHWPEIVPKLNAFLGQWKLLGETEFRDVLLPLLDMLRTVFQISDVRILRSSVQRSVAEASWECVEPPQSTRPATPPPWTYPTIQLGERVYHKSQSTRSLAVRLILPKTGLNREDWPSMDLYLLVFSIDASSGADLLHFQTIEDCCELLCSGIRFSQYRSAFERYRGAVQAGQMEAVVAAVQDLLILKCMRQCVRARIPLGEWRTSRIELQDDSDYLDGLLADLVKATTHLAGKSDSSEYADHLAKIVVQLHHQESSSSLQLLVPCTPSGPVVLADERSGNFPKSKLALTSAACSIGLSSNELELISSNLEVAQELLRQTHNASRIEEFSDGT